MGYKLRCDLKKSEVYELCCDHVQTMGVLLPSIRKCEFKKHRGTYWLCFATESEKDCIDKYDLVELNLLVFGGYARLQCDFYDSYHGCWTGNQQSIPIDIEYLLEHGYCKEAAA